jgi:hypothetical protein
MSPFSTTQSMMGIMQSVSVPRLEKADAKISLTKKLKMKSPYLPRQQTADKHTV